mmetsp:Transcript_150532/g.419459  ORF Transcript_150532/g.419459 Transcript_150532/m.419459 type:complete len:206 (-) Transcript_150532:8-625(-)
MFMPRSCVLCGRMGSIMSVTCTGYQAFFQLNCLCPNRETSGFSSPPSAKSISGGASSMTAALPAAAAVALAPRCGASRPAPCEGAADAGARAARETLLSGTLPRWPRSRRAASAAATVATAGTAGVAAAVARAGPPAAGASEATTREVAAGAAEGNGRWAAVAAAGGVAVAAPAAKAAAISWAFVAAGEGWAIGWGRTAMRCSGR